MDYYFSFLYLIYFFFLPLCVGSLLIDFFFKKMQFKIYLSRWERPILKESHIKKDELLFHDLINLTHGLKLFLSHRISSNKNLSLEDSESLLAEVKALELMLKDHFGLRHKNLSKNREWVSFDIAKKVIKSLEDYYLSDKAIQINYLYNDLLLNQGHGCLVHHSTFYRIMNNLIKNMGESETNEIVMSFSYCDQGLNICLKNKMNATKKTLGLGIESVKNLCENQNGSFEYSIHNGFWISEVFLPTKNGPLEEFDQAI